MRRSYQIVYLVFEVLAISICKELLLHGDMLHVLRQFGDWDAVILTAVVAVCLSHSCTTILMELTFRWFPVSPFCGVVLWYRLYSAGCCTM